MSWKKAIPIAAKWWADHLRHFHAQNNGDGLTSMLLTIAAGNLPDPTAEQTDAFEKAIADLLTEEVKKRTRRALKYGIGLDMDYDPCLLLGRALEKAGLRESARRLPCKSHMNIERGQIQATCGYRAPWETIYQEKRT